MPTDISPDSWLEEQFEFELCEACGGDADKHIAITVFDNWFALCDPDLPTGQVHLRDIRLRNNTGMNFPVCAADEEPLDMDKARWVITGEFEEITCPNCKKKGPEQYPWAFQKETDATD